jgi:predicted dinucleotide-binding enzyme
MMQKIGVLGSGGVAQTLAAGLKKHGYQVRIGSREPAKLAKFAAKSDVARILEQFGWEAVDMGGAAAARAIEPLCQLWCILGFRQNSWTHAFKVLWS